MRDKMSYENYNVAVYCTVSDVNYIAKHKDFDKELSIITDNINVGRVYLEAYRSNVWADKDTLLAAKDFFNSKGIMTSGGITTSSSHDLGEGFVSLCYSNEDDRDQLYRAIKLLAECFDEIIFDDFYFLNCRCPECVNRKGDRTWAEFRAEQKKDITENLVIKPAKEVNPEINVIIKYPQWYEAYNETGYDLIEEPKRFDTIYTGTETRNPDYCQQHLPKYLSYFIMSYLESAAPGRNLGGWYDPFECAYNITSYLEQGYLTLFGKAKEVTLFCMGALLRDNTFKSFIPSMGEAFRQMDRYLGELGNMKGVVGYRPGYGHGEDNIHSYLGMCGIPIIGAINYPENADTIFLAESAADDADIIAKIKKSLMNGAEVICSSGFVRRMKDDFVREFVNIKYSSRKAFAKEYLVSKDNGLTISGKYHGDEQIIIPQLDYNTNDVWELAGAYGTGNNFPIVLRCRYGRGHIGVLTIPDNMGDMYHYPREVLSIVRDIFAKNLPATLDAPAGVMMLVYDNDTMIVRSDLAFVETITVNFTRPVKSVTMLDSGMEIETKDNRITLQATPGVNYVVRLN